MNRGGARRWILTCLIGGAVLVGSCRTEPAATRLVTQEDLLRMLETHHEMLVLDVRTPGEYSGGHVPGAVNIPHSILEERVGEIRVYRDKDVVVYCEAGPRARTAERILRTAGFERLLHLEGDMSAWRRKELPLEFPTGDAAP